MHEGRAALVHQLGLALRIEILRDVAHDAQQLALPGLQGRAVLFEEIEQVLLRQPVPQHALGGFQLGLRRLLRLRQVRHRAPQVAVGRLLVVEPLATARLILGKFQLVGAAIAEHALILQRVRGVEHRLHRLLAMLLLAFRDVALGEFEIIENAVRVGPLLEQIVVLEEVVMAERRVRQHQRLHRHGVLLHVIADARVGVDDDLVGERLIALAIEHLVAHEPLAERPMRIHQRHAD